MSRLESKMLEQTKKRVASLVIGCLVVVGVAAVAGQGLCCCKEECDPPYTVIEPASYCPGDLIHYVTKKHCKTVVSTDPCTKTDKTETIFDYWDIAGAGQSHNCTPPPPPPPPDNPPDNPGGPGGPGSPGNPGGPDPGDIGNVGEPGGPNGPGGFGPINGPGGPVPPPLTAPPSTCP